MPADTLTITDSKIIAAGLREELQFPAKMDQGVSDRLAAKLYDTTPTRSDLRFQELGGDAAAKTLMAETIAVDDEDLEELFCIVHGEFVPRAGMDIEHAFAHTDIRANQITFLEYLNNHDDFANAFLAEPGMDKFFRRDGQVIKGTGYFYKICYNDASNLWLLCHACNIKKSAGDALTWFRKQSRFFGSEFVKDVNTGGGIHNGVIIDRIYKQATDDKTVKIGQRQVNLHTDSQNAIGLGSFVRAWFDKHHRDEFEAQKAFYKRNYQHVKAQLAKISQLKTVGKNQEANDLLVQLQQESRRVYDYQRISTSVRATHPDNEPDTSADLKRHGIAAGILLISDKYAKAIAHQLSKKFNSATSDEIMSGLPILNLTQRDWETIEKMVQAADEHNPDELQKTIDEYVASIDFMTNWKILQAVSEKYYQAIEAETQQSAGTATSSSAHKQAASHQMPSSATATQRAPHLQMNPDGLPLSQGHASADTSSSSTSRTKRPAPLSTSQTDASHRQKPNTTTNASITQSQPSQRGKRGGDGTVAHSADSSAKRLKDQRTKVKNTAANTAHPAASTSHAATAKPSCGKR